MATSKLPQTIMVVSRRENGEPSVLIADTSADFFDDGEVVGTYELVNRGTKRIRHSVEPRTRR